MNAQRRKELNKALELVGQAKAIIEQVREAEQEAFDAMPESFQNGDKGEKANEAISSLESAEVTCEGIEDDIANAVGIA